jgi:hypothetical protein
MVSENSSPEVNDQKSSNLNGSRIKFDKIKAPRVA